MSQARTTTSHRTIKKWVEERGGQPTSVKATTKRSGKPGVLRIDFPDGKEQSLEPISWKEFFEKFDEENLAFLYQNKTDDGSTSRFCKFVERES